jgi:hypothetical protein
MTMRDALANDADAIKRLQDDGLAVADEAAMSQAIHDVYCGPNADHDHPNDKDREQARSLMSSLQRALAALYPA